MTKHWTDTLLLNLKKGLLFFMLGGFVFVLVGLVGHLAYDSFHTTSKFEDLHTKTGLLLDIKKCEHHSGGVSFTPAIIKFNEKNVKINLPCGQKISDLKNNVGSIIEIKEDPYHLSFFTNNLNIWHISSKNKVYYNYKDAFQKYGQTDIHQRNIFLILSGLFILILLKEYKKIYFLYNKSSLVLHSLLTPVAMETPQTFADKTTYSPNNSFQLYFLYVVLFLTIPLLYNGIFKHILFLLFGLPLLGGILLLIKSIRSNIYPITVCTRGIEFESFKKKLPTNFLNWKDIHNIKKYKISSKGRYGSISATRVDINLVQTSHNSLLSKINKSISPDFCIVDKHYKNGLELLDNIVFHFEKHNNATNNKHKTD